MPHSSIRAIFINSQRYPRGMDSIVNLMEKEHEVLNDLFSNLNNAKGDEKVELFSNFHDEIKTHFKLEEDLMEYAFGKDEIQHLLPIV